NGLWLTRSTPIDTKRHLGEACRLASRRIGRDVHRPSLVIHPIVPPRERSGALTDERRAVFMRTAPSAAPPPALRGRHGREDERKPRPSRLRGGGRGGGYQSKATVPGTYSTSTWTLTQKADAP